MNFQFTAKCLWNVFRMRSLMPINVTSLTLSFTKDTEHVEVMMEVLTSITDTELDSYFDDLMKKTMSEITTDQAPPLGTNPYKFTAKYFTDVKKWIEIMPKDILKSITITFQDISGVVLLVNMHDQVTLTNMQEYLQLVEEEDGMYLSVQRPENYTGPDTTL